MNTKTSNSNVASSGTLFTLIQSWHDSVAVFEQLAFASTGDTILLTQDAVLALQSQITLASFLAKCESLGVMVAALSEDCHLRGIKPHSALVKMIDYAGFVELVCKHNKQVSW
ncbi:MAG: tRNA 2-thiouridine synthesizing protein B [Arenicella sp.]